MCSRGNSWHTQPSPESRRAVRAMYVDNTRLDTLRTLLLSAGLARVYEIELHGVDEVIVIDHLLKRRQRSDF
jgi:hypothetical protein